MIVPHYLQKCFLSQSCLYEGRGDRRDIPGSLLFLEQCILRRIPASAHFLPFLAHVIDALQDEENFLFVLPSLPVRKGGATSPSQAQFGSLSAPAPSLIL